MKDFTTELTDKNKAFFFVLCLLGSVQCIFCDLCSFSYSLLADYTSGEWGVGGEQGCVVSTTNNGATISRFANKIPLDLYLMRR